MRFFSAYSEPDNQNDVFINIKPEELEELISNNNDLILLDIRTAPEFEQGHLPNALNIDFYAPDFEQELALLDKEKEYLLYCRSGSRSSAAIALMKKLGFKKVYHLPEGLVSMSI